MRGCVIDVAAGLSFSGSSEATHLHTGESLYAAGRRHVGGSLHCSIGVLCKKYSPYIFKLINASVDIYLSKTENKDMALTRF